MKITEKKLREVIKNVIKENYDSVPESPGVYTSEKKHVAGNLWNLLNCKSEVKAWLSNNGFDESTSQHEILLNKIVFGNYGPRYNYDAGIYYGGYDWNEEINVEDSRLKARAAMAIVKRILNDLGKNTIALTRKFEGKQMYNELANPNNVAYASQGPGKPPKYAYASQGPQEPQQHAIEHAGGRSCLVVTTYYANAKDRKDFYEKTGLRLKPMHSDEHASPYTCLIVFLENNRPFGYQASRSCTKTTISNDTSNWVENRRYNETTVNQEITKRNVQDLLNLNNLDKSEVPYILPIKHKGQNVKVARYS